MMRLLVFAVLLTAAVSEKIKGIAFSTGHDTWGYRQPFTDVSLRNLKKTGTRWVHLTPYLKMPSRFARTSFKLTKDEDIRYIIQKTKKAGFKVFLKPQVEIKDFDWRGFIPGANDWFDKVYIPWIRSMAIIAKQEGVELFSIGSELKYSVHNTKKWWQVIGVVRKNYPGKITYVANHDSYKWVKFWKGLDMISISAYFKLLPGVTGYSPDLAETKKLWEAKAAEVNDWRIKSGLRSKKILIAEFGAMAKGNGVIYRTPWEWTFKGPTDLEEQKKMYEAFLSVFMPKCWIKGVVLYNWELHPEYGLKFPEIQWYTPQNKPALQVMKKYFWRTYKC